MSIKNDIFDNLKTAFESISHDNGYDSDVGLVSLSPITMEVDNASLPAIGISGDAEELVVAGTTNNRYSTAISLLIFMRDHDDIHRELANIVADIKKLIYDDIESDLGDNCLKLLYISTSAEAIEQSGGGFARMELELIWWDVR